MRLLLVITPKLGHGGIAVRVTADTNPSMSVLSRKDSIINACAPFKQLSPDFTRSPHSRTSFNQLICDMFSIIKFSFSFSLKNSTFSNSYFYLVNLLLPLPILLVPTRRPSLKSPTLISKIFEQHRSQAQMIWNRCD